MSSLLQIFSRPPRLTVGANAPELVAIDQDGASVSLSEAYQRGPVLLFFYVRAGTPVCTVHACRYRDSFANLKEKDLQIFGVSNDPPERLKKFRDKRSLPYRLLSDADGKIAAAFRVRSFFGFPERRAFFIRAGRIEWERRAGDVSMLGT